MNSRKEAILKQRLWRKPNKRLQVFLVCLLISAFIWLTREITKEGNSLVSIPVEITGLSPELAITSEFPKTIEATVATYGLSRLKTELSKNPEGIKLDLSNVANPGIIDIQSGQIAKLIQRSLGSGTEIIRFVPEDLQLKIAKITSKKVKIIPSVTLSIAEGYFLENEITCDPDSIELYAVQSSLDTITRIYTNKITLNQLNNTYSQTVECNIPNGVKTSVKNTKLKIPIDEYTEGEIYKKLLPVMKGGKKITFFPDSVKIVYRVGLNKYDEVNADEITLEVDLSEDESSSKRQVSVIKHPKFLNNLRLFPDRVEYYIFDK